MNQRVITKILSSCGFTQVTVVNNGLKAVQAIKNSVSEPFHLIFMDVMVTK
jgi:CheY-like chemotaxis protein